MTPKITYCDNGNKRYEHYYLNGKYHYTNGPAWIGWHKNGQTRYEQYWVNGKLHNPNGPACIGWDENGQTRYEHYYLNGQQIMPEWFSDMGFDIEHDFKDEDIRNMVILHNGGLE